MKLALERGFYFPSCEIYSDAPAGFWEYGPRGVSLKNKFIDLWRRELVRRDGMIEIDGSQIMSRSVFIASGHITNFTDPIIKCTKCGSSFRADRYINEKTGLNIPERLNDEQIDQIIKNNQVKCQNCNGEFGKVNRFNMMFRVGIGPTGEDAYLRPETCQTIFVDFARIFKTMRGRLPMGVAQIGKSFRNEISPRQSLLRLREFYQAEIEVFCNPNRMNDMPKFDEVKDTILNIFNGNAYFQKTAEATIVEGLLPNKLVAYYLSLLTNFYSKTGIDMKRTRFRQLADEDRAFYASVAFDFEVETSIGWLELVACNYRSDYDLKGHSSTSKQNFEIVDPSDLTKIIPHVFELSMGIDRSLYAILEHSYFQDFEHENRLVLKLKPYLAPIFVGVLPLVNKDGLAQMADSIYSELKQDFDVYLDISGSIGRRYRRLEEIGTPYAITVDRKTLEDGTVTIRERDSMEQSRVEISELYSYLNNAVRLSQQSAIRTWGAGMIP
jgi:glycyl-tRNA synthetase